MACIGMLVDLCGASRGGRGDAVMVGFLNRDMKGLKREILTGVKNLTRVIN